MTAAGCCHHPGGRDHASVTIPRSSSGLPARLTVWSPELGLCAKALASFWAKSLQVNKTARLSATEHKTAQIKTQLRLEWELTKEHLSLQWQSTYYTFILFFFYTFVHTEFQPPLVSILIRESPKPQRKCGSCWLAKTAFKSKKKIYNCPFKDTL